jgi:hypothetical protein
VFVRLPLKNLKPKKDHLPEGGFILNMTEQKRDYWTELKGKRVELSITRNNTKLNYTGLVLDVSEVDAPARWLYLKDKFDEIVIFKLTEINYIREATQ